MIQLTGNKYVVTGGAGFIGSHIAEEIVRQGKEVIVIDNLVSGSEDNLWSWWNHGLCKFFKIDISDVNDVLTPLPRNLWGGVDVVFHNAASKCTVCRDNPGTDLMTNAWGTHNVFAACIKYRIPKVIYASTGSVLNFEPLSFYGASKGCGEMYAKVFKNYYPDKFDYEILRYCNIYGTRQSYHDGGGVIPIFIRNIIKNEPILITGDGEQVRHFTWVKDVVNVNFLMAETSIDNVHTYDVVSDVSVTINELAIEIQRVFKTYWPNIYAKFTAGVKHIDDRPGDIKFPVADNELLKRTGFVFVNDLIMSLYEVVRHYLGIIK